MRRLSLGEYPSVSLEEARRRADERRRQRNDGIDPRAERDREHAAQSQADITFSDLCDRYIEHVKARGKVSWKTDEGYLKRPRAKFGTRAVAAITKRELLDFLEIVAQTSKASANRTQSTLRTVWGWAAERDLIPMNFLAGVKRVGGKETEKDRVLTVDELKAFFAILNDEKAGITEAVRLALKVVLLTAQRPGEVAGMMKSELHDLDGAQPHWIIPALRTKNKKAEHTVPLSAAAVQLIRSALEIGAPEEGEDRKDRPVFASRYESVEALARHSLSQAVRRLIEDKEIAAFTPHDLRRTAATLVQAARLPVDYVKALLNHNDKGVTGVYARWHMFEEKRDAGLAIEQATASLL